MKKSLIFLVFALFTQIALAQQTFTVEVLDKHNMPVANAPVYVEVFSKATRLSSGGGLPIPQSYNKLQDAKMWKTGRDGKILVKLPSTSFMKKPSIQVTIGVVGHTRSREMESRIGIGSDRDGNGAYVFPDLEPQEKLTPENLPSKLVAKTYYADAQQVQENITEALRRLDNYPVIPGYRE
jgi:hypothetical protein